jgi:ABC-type antimicrobial peptide transport system ATPase subunit
MTITPPLLVPANLKFRPIFLILNVEAEIHPKSNVSQLVEEPLSLSLIMKKKKEIMKVWDTFKINGPRIFLGQNL